VCVLCGVGHAEVVPFLSEFFSVIPLLSYLFAPEVGLYSHTPEATLPIRYSIHDISMAFNKWQHRSFWSITAVDFGLPLHFVVKIWK